MTKRLSDETFLLPFCDFFRREVVGMIGIQLEFQILQVILTVCHEA